MQTMQIETDALQAVNDRLEKGEGWIGYRYSKNDAGDKVRSKFLYLSFYNAGQQKFVNTKTNDPEEAYKQLLEARKQVKDGERLPSEVSKLRYEDLIKLLMDYYREKHPASIYTRQTDDGGAEDSFSGKDDLDKFFRRMPITQITATKIKEFIAHQKRQGYAGPTIRRQLNRLRSAFSLAKKDDLLSDNNIPSFNLPEDSKARKGFLDFEDFQKLCDAVPEHIRPTMTFLYFTGCRSGAAKKITWEMVSKDCEEIEIAGEITKNGEPLIVPLAGPLESVGDMLRYMRRVQFRQANELVFCFRNFRKIWDEACHKLGLGVFNKTTGHYKGLSPHDFRRSAARNLIKAGVDRRTAMMITGHKTEEIFERYNIKNTQDVKDALIKVGQFKNAQPISITAAR
jgi:integrase